MLVQLLTSSTQHPLRILDGKLDHNIIANSLHFKREIDRKRFLIGRLLIAHMLKLQNGEADLGSMKYGKYRKPYFQNSMEFNLSHSGKLVVLAFANSEIGIDIEHIKPQDIKIANTVFSKNELKALTQSKNQLRTFYNTWTKKEAIVKATGIGLNSRLQTIDTTKKPTYFESKYFFIKKANILSEHICHIATTEKISALSVTNLTCNEL